MKFHFMAILVLLSAGCNRVAAQSDEAPVATSQQALSTNPFPTGLTTKVLKAEVSFDNNLEVEVQLANTTTSPVVISDLAPSAVNLIDLEGEHILHSSSVGRAKPITVPAASTVVTKFLFAGGGVPGRAARAFGQDVITKGKRSAPPPPAPTTAPIKG
jgi:hypothetical protein